MVTVACTGLRSSGVHLVAAREDVRETADCARLCKVGPNVEGLPVI